MSKEVRKPSVNHPKHPVVKPPIPDNLFIEMDVLKPEGWQEQARWLKFEETLLEGADRWGNPHVSSLTFHSLINLRLVLEKGEE
jgi:solute carrier family 4 anion exchanger 2